MKWILSIGIILIVFAVFIFNELNGNSVENYRLSTFGTTTEAIEVSNEEQFVIDLPEATGSFEDLLQLFSLELQTENERNKETNQDIEIMTSDTLIINEFTQSYDESSL